jgi:hypothetical protein
MPAFRVTVVNERGDSSEDLLPAVDQEAAMRIATQKHRQISGMTTRVVKIQEESSQNYVEKELKSQGLLSTASTWVTSLFK